MIINAAVAISPDKPFQLGTFELEEPREDEVLVKIAASGICHTDIAVKQQSVHLPLPMILGHEGSGVVEAIGNRVSELKVGDHVILTSDSCGSCKKCEQRLPSYCNEFVERNLSGRRIDGTSPVLDRSDSTIGGRFVGQSSFASHSLVSERSAVKIDKSHPLRLMGPLGCGLMTGVGTVFHALEASSGNSIAIFGAGTVGLSSVMGSKLRNCHPIIAVDPLKERRDIAKELGATHALDSKAEDLVEQIIDLSKGGVDFSIEASGSPSAVDASLKCLGRPGWAAQVGATPAQTYHSLDMDHLGFGRGIKGVVMGDAYAKEFVPHLAALHSKGRLPFEKFVKEYKFDEINEAIRESQEGSVIKPILIM